MPGAGAAGTKDAAALGEGGRRLTRVRERRVPMHGEVAHCSHTSCSPAHPWPERSAPSLCATRAVCPGATRSGFCRPGTDVTCTLARQTQPPICFVEPPTQPLKLKKEEKKNKAAAVDFIIGPSLNKLHTIIS